MKWEAVFLASGQLEEKFSSCALVPSKAYLPIHDRPMSDYVLDVLRAIPKIQRIVAVIPPGAPLMPSTAFAAGGETLIESLSSGFKALSAETDMAVVVTCDIPCVTIAGVEDFLAQCEACFAGLHYSFVAKHESEKMFPGAPHTYVKLREGIFCGGGLIAISPKHFPSLVKLAENATRNRKNIFALAKIFGIPFILKFLFRKLSIRDLEIRAGELLGFPVKGVLSKYPEIAFNVDNSETLGLASKFLSDVKKRSIN